MGMNLFSRVMHQLIVCAAKYFPVPGEGRVRDDEVARRIAISTSYFCVVDADSISRRGLGINGLEDERRRTERTQSYLYHDFIGTVSVGNEMWFDQRAELKPLPLLIHSPRQGLRDSAHLGTERQPRVRSSCKTDVGALPSVQLEHIDSLGYDVISYSLF
jgi:hypothetical protein